MTSFKNALIPLALSFLLSGCYSVERACEEVRSKAVDPRIAGALIEWTDKHVSGKEVVAAGDGLVGDDGSEFGESFDAVTLGLPGHTKLYLLGYPGEVQVAYFRSANNLGIAVVTSPHADILELQPVAHRMSDRIYAVCSPRIRR